MFRFLAMAVALSLICLSPQTLHASVESEIQTRAPQALQSIYQQRQLAPLWLAEGQPTERARQAVAAIKAAAEDALLPENYALSSLEQQLDLLNNEEATDLQLAVFDLALSRAVASFTHDLAIGRVDPQQLGLAIDNQAKREALPTRIDQVLLAPDIPAALDSVRPAFAAYNKLRALLPTYRHLAAQHPDKPALPPLPGGKPLKPGMPWAGSSALANWLTVLGNMPSNMNMPANIPAEETTPENPELYAGAVVEGVQHFQAHHGLNADGVIGTQTYRALMTPLPERVQQIEVALERLRWPDDSVLQRRFIIVNIPQFTLWAYEPEQPAITMNVVTGKAKKTQTPVLTKTLSTVVFSPYWNVPRSIALKELTPKLREDPGYLNDQNMEMVRNDGSIYPGAVDEDALARLRRGELRIRQRPGDKNALGGVKFVFPNDDAIYMHDTPQQTLFAKDRRDFSHGCIRVSNPVALALYALKSNGAATSTTDTWDEARIREQMLMGKEQHIALKEKIPVLVLYTTVNIDADGNAIFVQDIYQQDREVAHALAQH